MKNIRILILVLVGLGIVGLAVYGIAYKLPSRTVTWANGETANQSGNIGDFFKKLFTKSDITLVVFGKPGAGYGGGGLADAILVIHFNPSTQKAHLISLPRDLWVADDSEQFKINEVFIKNKVPFVMKKIEDLTGLKTNGYVIVDLNMLASIVDWLGGIDIVLSQPAVDWVSSFQLDAGAHHLNGEYAVWLVRNRYNQQGDFFRESNQHLVMEALLDKFQKLSADQKDEFLKTFIFRGSFLQNAQVDFAKLTSYMFGADISEIRFESIVLDFTTKLFKTAYLPIQTAATTTNISILIPTEGFEKYKNIREYIEEKMKE